MKSNQNIVIVLLLISAAVLTAFLVADYFGTGRQARADAPAQSPSFAVVRPSNIYTMCTGAWDKDVDILYVLDTNSQRLNAYVTNTRTEAIELFDSISLPQAFRR